VWPGEDFQGLCPSRRGAPSIASPLNGVSSYACSFAAPCAYPCVCLHSGSLRQRVDLHPFCGSTFGMRHPPNGSALSSRSPCGGVSISRLASPSSGVSCPRPASSNAPGSNASGFAAEVFLAPPASSMLAVPSVRSGVAPVGNVLLFVHTHRRPRINLDALCL